METTTLSVSSFNKRKGEHIVDNYKAQQFWKTRMKLLTMSAFKWTGLPDGIPPSFIERMLFSTGTVAIAKDRGVGFVCCNYINVGGKTDLYGEPLRIRLIAPNGYNKTFDMKDAVIINNNSESLPTAFFNNYYLKKFFEIDRTIDVNIRQQKTPRIVKATQDTKLTMENLAMEYDGNKPYIIVDESVNMDKMEIFDNTAPYIADRMQDLKVDLWGEYLDVLGINNANTSKRERLVVDEVNANNQELGIATDVFLEARQFACQKMKEIWNIDVQVERRYLNGSLYDGTRGTDESDQL